MSAPHFAPINLGPVSIQLVRVYFAKAGVEVPVPHDLRAAPIGWTPAGIDKHATIKDGITPLASKALSLISDTDGVGATILVWAINFSQR